MKIISHFDTGVSRPFEVHEREIVFDLRSDESPLDVVICHAPLGLRVTYLIESEWEPCIRGQGLLYRTGDHQSFSSVPFQDNHSDPTGALQDDDSKCVSTCLPVAGEVRIATQIPYGRDDLDRLLCESLGSPAMSAKSLTERHRSLIVFEFGEDDGKRPIHFIVAGEDWCETPGAWVVDSMIRLLGSDNEVARALRTQAFVRLVPLASPYSATQGCGSYRTLEGDHSYAAATWADKLPPPEIHLLRALVVDAIARRRLGVFLNLHSTLGAVPYSELEVLSASRGQHLDADRAAWAQATMERLIEGVPFGSTTMAEEIWYPGLARDALLAFHNAISFRLEVTSHAQGVNGFRETARRLLENMTFVDDWGPVLGRGV